MLGSFAEATLDELRDGDSLAAAIARLGLERPTRLPDGFPVAFGGLGIWQTPIQFAPYLIAVGQLDVRRYVEFGVHTAGSLVATVDYLDRFAHVERVLAVDMELQAIARDRVGDRRGVELLAARTDAPAVEARLAAIRPDLVLVDADHSERGCRHDFELAARHARYVALHDIVEWTCPGVAAVWGSIDAPKRAFDQQYDSGPPIHGIGLIGPLR